MMMMMIAAVTHRGMNTSECNLDLLSLVKNGYCKIMNEI